MVQMTLLRLLPLLLLLSSFSRAVIASEPVLRQLVVPLPSQLNPVETALALDPELESRVQSQAADLPIAQKARLLDMYMATEFLTDGRLNESRLLQLSGGLGFGIVHDLYPPTADIANRLQQLVMQDSGVPVLTVEECLHGLLQAGHTAFPAPLGLAATFNPPLIEQMAAVISREARALGIRMCLSPVLGAAREPRWGRSEETFGEDSFLIASMARHYTLGMQGTKLSNETVVAEPKHYAAHSIPEGGRNTAVSHLGPREMLDTFLPQFESAVRAGALSVMSAYSEYDGVACSGSYYLLTEKLRRDFGFKGFVLSDLGAVSRLWDTHHQAASPQAAVLQFLIAGGNSQFYDFSHEVYQQAIIDGVADGSLPQSVLDARVADVLRVRELLQLNTQPSTDTSRVDTELDSPEARALALETAKQSIVLLKNSALLSDGQPLLPLAPRVQSGGLRRIALVGMLADVLNVADYSGPFNNINAGQSSTLLGSLAARTAANSTALSFSPALYPSGRAELLTVSHHHFPAGVAVSFYTSTDLSGPVALNRTDPSIGYSFWHYGFDRRFPSNSFSGRWTAELLWPASLPNGRLALFADELGAVRLWLDGQLLVDEWDVLGQCQPCVLNLSFVAGSRHELVMEYWQQGLDQTLYLLWDIIGNDSDAAIARALQDAAASDVIVAVVGDSAETCSEGVDRSSLELAGRQQELVLALAELGKPLVMVMFSGRAPSIPLLAANPNVSAIVEAFDPGQSQGDALTAVLYGDFNPAGRLPLTYPVSVGQLPLFYNHKFSGWIGNYADLNPSLPVFPFGFGLSYTQFNYSSLLVQPLSVGVEGVVSVSFVVTNVGQRDGEEVSQLYLTDVLSWTTTPVQQLRGFARFHLAAGEAVNVTLMLNVSAACRLVNRQLQWEVEPGLFVVTVGPDSSDLRGPRLQANFTVVDDVQQAEVEAEREKHRITNQRVEKERLQRLQDRQRVKAMVTEKAVE